MTQIFYVHESYYNPGKYMIGMEHDRFKLFTCGGSFNLIMARVLGISYANYLRLCRDSYNAELVGKKSGYPVAHFKTEKDALPLVMELNKRANKILQIVGV